MSPNDSAPFASRKEVMRPEEWLEEVERIRSRMLLIEGLLASMVLDRTSEKSERLGKALQCADSIFGMVDRLALSMRSHGRADDSIREKSRATPEDSKDRD